MPTTICFKSKILIPKRAHFSVGKELYKELWGQGLSMGLMMGIVSTGTVILQTAINELGYLTIAGHTAARKLNSFCTMPVVAIAQAVSTFVSQNKGANQGYRIRKSVFYSNLIAISWGVISSVILFFISPMMVKVLSGSSEVLVIENGARYLRINAPFYGVLGILLNLRYSLQGLGQKITPLLSSIIEFGGKILFVILIIPKTGYLGVILCEPIIWCFMTAQLAYAFYKNTYIGKFKVAKEFSIV